MVFFFAITGLINTITALILGSLVFLSSKPKKQVKISFWFVSVSVIWWSFSYFLWLSSSDVNNAMFWVRMLSIGSVLIPVSFLHWIYTLFEIQDKKILKLCYLFTFFILLFSYSTFFIKGVRPIAGFDYWPIPGMVYNLYLFVGYFGILGFGLFKLLQLYKKSSSVQRLQLKYLIAGVIVGCGGGATNFFLWYGVNVLPYGNVLVSAYPILFTYAIVKHRLMNIRLVITRSFLFSILVLLVSGFFTAAVLVTRLFFDTTSISTLIFINVIVGIIIVLTLAPIRNLLAKATDHFFFKNQIDHQAVAQRLSNLVSTNLDRDELLIKMARELRDELKVKKADILYYYHQPRGCGIYYSQKTKEKGTYDPAIRKHLLNEYHNLTKFFTKYSNIHVREEEERRLDEGNDGVYQRWVAKIVNELEGRGVALVVPVISRRHEKAFILIGDKYSGDVFDNQDVNLFELIKTQLASALDKSKLYAEAQDFNAQLKKKINDATKELRQANARLRELDKAKTLFLSVASHQLRTPLSGIKGFLSMVLEKDFGTVPPQINTVLAEVYANTNRLIRLVNTFLNVSRIEAGRLSIMKREEDLVLMSKKIIDELQFVAKDKKLELRLETNKDVILAEIDADKIEDVLINLVDNAIKYTVAGQVVLRLIDHGAIVRAEVVDTGQGLEAKEIKLLFNKFVRGTRSFAVHTDGSGLGLYIAKRLVDLHGGKIGVDSPGIGKGCMFWIELPKK
ncbi:MAG: hypothetical protein A2295_04445 [Candidatus Jacksonbacteria bacterium RIFOXYB2_FULL_44_15]|nr:MAG: hypothetical protein A2295_04445 [Candidatus Jacksonbacteria bacterium RIFOXYB2_FULL_44_15]